MSYIDVRGVWPVLVNGNIQIELVGLNRSITVEEAKILLDMQANEPKPQDTMDLDKELFVATYRGLVEYWSGDRFIGESARMNQSVEFIAEQLLNAQTKLALFM